MTARGACSSPPRTGRSGWSRRTARCSRTRCWTSAALISTGFEQGLLGLATHPTFPTDPRIFLNYTNTEGDSIVASAKLDPGDPDRLDPTTLTKLLFVDQPYANHNGGSVQFGPDGKLYLSFGDGGSGGDPRGNGQNVDVLLGKILRIDIDGAGAGPYAIPPDNPYAAAGGLPEIWLWGLRNPWRMSFDRATGDLWIGDVGQGVVRGGRRRARRERRANFGWNVMEGSHCFNHRTCATEGLTFPVVRVRPRDLGCTVIGGYVYRGHEVRVPRRRVPLRRLVQRAALRPRRRRPTA